MNVGTVPVPKLNTSHDRYRNARTDAMNIDMRFRKGGVIRLLHSTILKLNEINFLIFLLIKCSQKNCTYLDGHISALVLIILHTTIPKADNKYDYRHNHISLARTHSLKCTNAQQLEIPKIYHDWWNINNLRGNRPRQY